MAPFNLSDLAVKELKISEAHLSPAKPKSFVGKLLVAHFLDFWAIFWATTFATAIFQAAFKLHLTTSSLNKAWGTVSLSPFAVFAWTSIALTYFFMSYFLNQGQTAGMKIMKCRVKMPHHSFKDALHWAVKSFGIYVTMGFNARAFSANVAAHDYLWHELVAQKEVVAPDVMSLVKEDVKEEFAEAA